MSLWLVLLASGLGAMKVVDLVKEIIPWPLQPWSKSVCSMAAAGTMVYSFVDSGERFALLMFGAAGLAAVLHELTDALWLTSDFLKQQVILRGARRR